MTTCICAAFLLRLRYRLSSAVLLQNWNWSTFHLCFLPSFSWSSSPRSSFEMLGNSTSPRAEWNATTAWSRPTGGAAATGSAFSRCVYLIGIRLREKKTRNESLGNLGLFHSRRALQWVSITRTCGLWSPKATRMAAAPTAVLFSAVSPQSDSLMLLPRDGHQSVFVASIIPNKLLHLECGRMVINKGPTRTGKQSTRVSSSIYPNRVQQQQQ